MNLINWLSFSVIIVGILIYTKFCRKKIDTGQSYFVSDRETHLFALVATLVMTELNTSTLVGFAGLGYKFGYSAISLSLVFLVGLLFYALSVAKKWKRFDGIAVTTYFSKRYHPLLGSFSAILMIIAMIGFSANFIKSLTLLFNPMFPSVNEWFISGSFCFVMLIVTLRKGLASVIRIDKISFCLVVAIFISMLFFGDSKNIGNINNIIDNSHSISSGFVVALTIITMFTYIMSPWYGQKIFSASSAKTAFYSVVIAAVFVSFIYGIAIYAASSIAVLYPHIQPQNAIPIFIAHRIPMVIQGIVYATLFFIAMTTLAALWNTIASVYIAHYSSTKHRNSLIFTRSMTLVIAIISYILANVFIDKIFDKMVLMNIPIASLAFPLLGGFYWKRVSIVPCIISIVFGIIGGLSCYFYFGENNFIWYWAVYVIPIQFIAGILAVFFTKTGTIHHGKQNQ
jgi:solute:Na+ symporter, SSS family